jgi:hypothetical protein
MNAGLEFMQKHKSLSLSFFEIEPLLQSSVTALAPTGYPPMIPSISAVPAHPGSRYIFCVSGSKSRPKRFPRPLLIINVLKTRKGKSDGMTELPHKVRPLRTPVITGCGAINNSSINIVQISAIKIVLIRDFNVFLFEPKKSLSDMDIPPD